MRRPAVGGCGGGISSLNLTRDGRTLFFREGSGVYSVSHRRRRRSAGRASARPPRDVWPGRERATPARQLHRRASRSTSQPSGRRCSTTPGGR